MTSKSRQAHHRMVALALLCAGLAATVRAEDAVLEKQPADLRIELRNPAHDEPVTASRVVVRAPGAVLEVVAETGRVAGETVFRSVPIYNFKPYIVTARVDGVDYHAQQSGQDFLDGKAAVVHAFPTTDELDGLAATGMNVVLHQRGDEYTYEAIVTLENRSRPQRTIRADALPLRLALPEGIGRIEVEVDRGPDPATADLRAVDGMHGVAVPLPPGKARVTVRGSIPIEGDLRFDVACNLPLDRWSLMTWPKDLRVRSSELREDTDQQYGGLARWRGRALQPGERVPVVIAATTSVAAAPVFGDAPTTSGEPEPAAEPSGRGIPWVTITVAVVLLGAYAIWRRRR
ncbi:hypothetical protein GF314_05910 [bacterium]|nr:hypothetical protein [bacterium]